MSLGTVLEACIALYAALILAELFVRKQWLRFVLQAVVLLFVIGIALLVNNAVTLALYETSPRCEQRTEFRPYPQ
jgi:hypothetical protein